MIMETISPIHSGMDNSFIHMQYDYENNLPTSSIEDKICVHLTYTNLIFNVHLGKMRSKSSELLDLGVVGK